MKKKLTAFLFSLFLFILLPSTTVLAENCTHQWGEWEVIVEPSCAETGFQTRECILCHEEENKELPKSKKHSWEEWETTKKATALAPGKKVRFCAECEKKQTKELPQLEAEVSLKKKSATIETGKSSTLKIKAKTYGDKVASWSSSDKSVATVNKNGKVTGKQKGTATITVTMESGVTAACKIKVTAPKASSGSNGTSGSNGSSGSDNSGSGNSSGSSGSSSSGNQSTPVSDEVWIPRTGSKYHRSSSCSNMKSPRKVSRQTAIDWGYDPCKKCY